MNTAKNIAMDILFLVIFLVVPGVSFFMVCLFGNTTILAIPFILIGATICYRIIWDILFMTGREESE